MPSKKRYLNQSSTMVRRAEDALFSIVAGLSSPFLSKSGVDSQDFSLLLIWDPHFISLGVHEPVLGAGQEKAQSCDWEKLQSRDALESCRPLHCACESLVSETKLPPAAQISCASPTPLCFHNF